MIRLSVEAIFVCLIWASFVSSTFSWTLLLKQSWPPLSGSHLYQFLSSASCVRHNTRPASTGLGSSNQDYSAQSQGDFSFFQPEDSQREELDDEELEIAMGKQWNTKIAQFNTIHLTGRIGNDPELRYLDDGKVVLNLSLAHKRKYHALERQHLNITYGEEETNWYTLEVWGTKAEITAKLVDKGSRVGVIGSLQIDDWQDKMSGEKRSRVKVLVRELDVLESKAEAEARRERQREASNRVDVDEQSEAGGFFR